MKQKRTRTLLLLPVLCCAVLIAQPADKVVMTNTGKMNIADGGYNGVALYIQGAVLHSSNKVWVVQKGESNIGGGFYTLNGANVFDVHPASSIAKSSGIVRFVDSHPQGKKRMITTYTADSLTAADFDRGNNYIAFPHIRVRTTDSIIVPARMGIDALSVKKDGAAGNTGKLVLRSGVITVSGSSRAYDASLRITGSGTSANLVDAGIVTVEREVGIYRNTANQPLFPFAAPFLNTQLSGYFAGNWVRRPQADGDFGSTYYIFGNKDKNPVDGIIDRDQYIYQAAEKLAPSQAYLIKPRPVGFNYQNLKNSGGLWYTDADASLYDKGKFIFNGQVYSVPAYDEQLFAEDTLKTIRINGTSDGTINWLVGNSYTAPISTASLAGAMEAEASLAFLKRIYIFSAGSQTYQPISFDELSNYPDIPSMSVFLLILPRNTVQTGSFSITKDMLHHGPRSHNSPLMWVKADGNSRAKRIATQINFRVTPAENGNLYDLAAIGMHEDALLGSDSYDADKLYTDDPHSFQLYTLSSDGTKLSINGVPSGTQWVKLAFRPSSAGGEYTLEAAKMELSSTDGAWLFDNQTGTTIDLNVQREYTFAASPADNPERFIVYFRHPSELADGLPEITIDGDFKLHNLYETDLNAQITVYSVQGNLVAADKVSMYPVQSLEKNLLPGTYIIKIDGKSRNAVLKAVKK